MEENKIKLPAKKKNIKLPSKDTMNFYMHDGYGGPGQRKLIAFLAILAVLFLVFAVGARYYHVLNMYKELNQAKENLAAAQIQIIDYDSVKAEYDRYAKGYMTGTEKATESRIKIIKIAREAVGTRGTIDAISIVGNEAAVQLTVKNLDYVAAIRKELESTTDVSGVRVFTASESDSDTSGVKASLVFLTGQDIKESDQ